MEKPTWEDAVDEVLSELRATLIRKQRAYGHGNILAFGEKGVLVRANDKIARLKNLLWEHPDREPEEEPVTDSWMDLAGYSTIALMLRRGTFTRQLEEDEG